MTAISGYSFLGASNFLYFYEECGLSRLGALASGPGSFIVARGTIRAPEPVFVSASNDLRSDGQVSAVWARAQAVYGATMMFVRLAPTARTCAAERDDVIQSYKPVMNVPADMPVAVAESSPGNLYREPAISPMAANADVPQDAPASLRAAGAR